MFDSPLHLRRTIVNEGKCLVDGQTTFKTFSIRYEVVTVSCHSRRVTWIS